MLSRLIGWAMAAALMLGAVSPALAEEHRHDRDRRDDGRHREFRRDEGWRDRDIHRFRDHDFDRWRGGHWFHGRRDGRFGWWWSVGPAWYFYPRPIYPFPDPYVPSYAAPGASAWYFCPPAQNYYPYVGSCPVSWQIVPAQ
jgi:hypothetical protein